MSHKKKLQTGCMVSFLYFSNSSLLKDKDITKELCTNRALLSQSLTTTKKLKCLMPMHVLPGVPMSVYTGK